jgi:hypothetical protein
MKHYVYTVYKINTFDVPHQPPSPVNNILPLQYNLFTFEEGLGILKRSVLRFLTPFLQGLAPLQV